jgi:hypothetical protein
VKCSGRVKGRISPFPLLRVQAHPLPSCLRSAPVSSTPVSEPPFPLLPPFSLTHGLYPHSPLPLPVPAQVPAVCLNNWWPPSLPRNASFRQWLAHQYDDHHYQRTHVDNYQAR